MNSGLSNVPVRLAFAPFREESEALFPISFYYQYFVKSGTVSSLPPLVNSSLKISSPLQSHEHFYISSLEIAVFSLFPKRNRGDPLAGNLALIFLVSYSSF